METQKCYSCGRILTMDNFNKKKSTKSGYAFQCRECASEYRKKYYSKNKSKENSYSVQYQKENKIRVNKKRAEHRQEHPEYFLKHSEYVIDRKKKDLNFLVYHRYRSRIGRAFYATEKRATLPPRELLGCTDEQFIKHLESTFKDGMTWELYKKAELQIDHIIPCVCFDLSKENHQRACFHYSNTRMLFSNVNAGRKNNRYLSAEEIEKYVKDFIECH